MQEIIEKDNEITGICDAASESDAMDENTEVIADEPVSDISKEADTQSAAELSDEIDELRTEYPDVVASNTNVDPARYKQLRAMGLTMKEAYLATSERNRPADNKKHLIDSMPKSARSPATTMSRREMELARVLFDGMSDEQIKKLYNKVKS